MVINLSNHKEDKGNEGTSSRSGLDQFRHILQASRELGSSHPHEWRSPLLEFDHDLVDFDSVALSDAHFLDLPGDGGGNVGLHLHGF